MMLERFPEPDARLVVLDDADALAREGARRFVAAAGRAVEAGTMFRAALSGGSTPLPLYRALATDDALRYSVHWPSVELFWGDERFVPDDHPDSNQGAARRELVIPLQIPSERVHPIPTEEADPESAAAAYRRTLERAFAAGAPGPPRFDLVLLGLGEDGHTASLFPGALPQGDPDPWVAAVTRPADGSRRVTLTPAVLNAARQVLFLVSGESKAEALERVMRAEGPDPAIPATLIRPPGGKVTWLADRAAAARITSAPARSPGAGTGAPRDGGDR